MGDKAGKWLRVSTSGQDEESQHPDLARWCNDHEYDIRRTYTIHGKSAYKGNRKFDETWAQVLDDMRAGEIDVLVVWKQDRIDRKLNTFQMLAQVVDAGGRVEFVTQPQLNDLTTMGGRIALKIQEEIAYAESKDKSDRVLAKQDGLRAKGSIVGRPPWGYVIKCRDFPECNGSKCGHIKVLEPTHDGRNYTPAIFQMIIDGNSLRDVAAWLTTKDVATTTGKPWNEAYIGNRLIKNPVYYGQRRNAGQLETEELVTYSVWQQANAALTSRMRPGRDTVKHEKALLSPMCGNPDCDATGEHPSPMYRIFVGKDENRTAYYRCTGRGPQRKGCGNMVPLEWLDETVIEAMLADQMNKHYERVFVAGDDRSDEIGKLREAAMDAYRKGDKARFTELDAEADQLAMLPSVPPHWEEHKTGQTEGDWFASLDDSQRREALRDIAIFAHGDNPVAIGPRDLLPART
jgi:DNA invertase Pin-like site-specific DNA recombinase